MTPNRTPTYNLKVVVQETNIKPDTLRAWERRYGLPEPERTKGRHRLYSDYDIAIIKWLMLRQKEGLSISRAVKLWRSLEESGKNPFEEVLPSPLTNQVVQNHGTIVPAAVNDLSGSTVQELRQAWIDACLQYDEASAEAILTKAFALYPPEMVVLELLQKGLARLGEMWYQNKVTVQQEHFASALAMRRLNTLVTAAPPPNKPGKIIVACPTDEHHIFAPLFLTLLLRYQGYETIYLGANVPREYLENTVAAARPDLIVMTAQQLHTAATLYEIAKMLQDEGITFAYGGRIFNQNPDLQEHIPGHFLGTQLDKAITQIGDMISKRPLSPPTAPIPDNYSHALNHFRKNQAAIESQVWHNLQNENIPYKHLTNANMHLARDINAALTLGNVSLLSEEISWTEKLLLNYNMPAEHLSRYLKAYDEAAHDILNGDGEPILHWLDEIANDKNEA